MDININININNSIKKIKIDFALLGILFIAAFLRLYNLGFQSPWLDELSTIQMSDPNLTAAKSHELISTREGFPDFYFFLLKYLSQIFGHSIYTLRFFSALFGVLSVYVIYLWSKEMFTKRVAYIAAILLTFNFFHIYHSQDARTYTLLMFFVILANYRLFKFIKKIDLKNAVFLGIATGLIPNAHPIGLLNVAVIAIFLLVYMILETKKLERIKIFKFSLLIGILTVLLFLPVYPLFVRASELTAFWIQEPSFDTIKQAFFELLGSLNLNFYAYLIGFLVFCIILIFDKKTKNKIENKYILSFVIIWFLINIGIIIAKSYLDVSMILNRYFIGSLPLFIITLAYVIGSLKNKIVSYVLTFVFVGYSVHYMFYTRLYYTTVTKSQWDLVANEIIKNNSQKDKIIGAYGYVVSSLYLRTNSEGLGWEIRFEDYINSLRNNIREKESFWYIDGNYRPFNLSKEDMDFVNQYFVMDYQIDKFDCWAKHYTLKGLKSKFGLKKTIDKIYLSDIDSKDYDNLGNLLIFENKTISSRSLNLEKGTFELVLNANSLPVKPIENINAHIIIRHNEQIIGNCFLSEKSEQKENKFKFVNQDLSSVFTITFDNDLAKNNLDRNVIIYSIALNKLKK